MNQRLFAEDYEAPDAPMRPAGRYSIRGPIALKSEREEGKYLRMCNASPKSLGLGKERKSHGGQNHIALTRKAIRTLIARY